MYRLLKESEIDVRVGTVGAKGVTLLLYKDARVDMNILDETHGSECWQRNHREIKGNMYAGIGVWNDKISQWVWKWDCGTESMTEKEKGEASDSFKRACVNQGIGRELYTSPFIFVACETEQKDGRKYTLKNPFEFSYCRVENISYNEDREISALTIVNKQGRIIFSTTERPITKADKKADNKADNGPSFAEVGQAKIDDVQAAALLKLIKEKNSDVTKVCTAYNVESLLEMTLEQWNDCRKKLEKK